MTDLCDDRARLPNGRVEVLPIEGTTVFINPITLTTSFCCPLRTAVATVASNQEFLSAAEDGRIFRSTRKAPNFRSSDPVSLLSLHLPRRKPPRNAMNCFSCVRLVSTRADVIISRKLPWSLSVGGDQLISPDFAPVVGTEGRGTTTRAAESGTMLSRRHSKQIGNRSHLSLTLSPRAPFARAVCGLPRICATPVSLPRPLSVYKIQSQVERRSGEISLFHANLDRFSGSLALKRNPQTAAMQCFCDG